MSKIEYLSIQPFVPSGRDYAASRRFFAELGFEEQWESNGLAGFKSGDCSFILQEYDNDDFASNLMMKLVVPNLGSWWSTIQLKMLDTHFEGVRLQPPTQFPWGREVNIIDPAGVCWHVLER
jgi:hypothetical protein